MDKKGSQLIFSEEERRVSTTLPLTADVSQAPIIRGYIRAQLDGLVDRSQEVHASPMRGDLAEAAALGGLASTLSTLDRQLTAIIEPSPADGADAALQRWSQS